MIVASSREVRVRYRLQTIAAMTVAASAAHAQPEAPSSLELHLVCVGQRTQTEQEQTSLVINDGWGGNASGSAVTDRVVRVPGRIDVSVVGNAVKVNPMSILKRTPRWAVPEDGWYELTDVIIDQEQIAGRIRLTPLQKPSVRIDRRTGQIRMSGLDMRYDGSCERSIESMSTQKF